MSLIAGERPRVMELAERIEADIRDRGLRPGDSYLTAAETARMLGCNTAAVSRALQLLVQRRVLDRKPRTGATVAFPGISRQTSPLGRVYLLVHQNYIKTEGLLMDGTIIGMQSELPGVDVQFNFVPADDGEQYVSRLISEAARHPEPTGLVLVRSSLAIQRLTVESGLPTVVYGSLYPSVDSLSWLDRDHFAGGQLLARHALSQGCQKLIVLMRERFSPGDNPFLDGMQTAMTEAALSPDRVVIRAVPSDRKAVCAETYRLLSDRTKTGIIARSEPLADGAMDGIEMRELRLGSDVVAVISDVYRRGGENPLKLPYLVANLQPEAIGAHIGRMLAQRVKNPESEPEHELIPIALRLPGISRTLDFADAPDDEAP